METVGSEHGRCSMTKRALQVTLALESLPRAIERSRLHSTDMAPGSAERQGSRSRPHRSIWQDREDLDGSSSKAISQRNSSVLAALEPFSTKEALQMANGKVRIQHQGPNGAGALRRVVTPG